MMTMKITVRVLGLWLLLGLPVAAVGQEAGNGERHEERAADGGASDGAAHNDSDDDRYRRLVEQAIDCTRKDSLRQAEQLYREALQLDPTNARNALLFSNLGTVLRRQGRADEAVEAYTLALNITPYSTAMLLNRASLYLEQGRDDLAYVDYCNVVDLLPDEPEARLMRAYIYQRRRQYKEARADYNAVLRQDSRHKTARMGLLMVDEKEGRQMAAMEEMNRLVQEYPDDTTLLLMRANLYLNREQWEVALLDLETVVEREAQDPAPCILMGDACLRVGRKSEARKAFERAIARGVPPAELRERLKECK